MCPENLSSCATFQLRQRANQNDQARIGERETRSNRRIVRSAFRVPHSAFIELPSFRQGTLTFEFHGHFASEPVQFADGQHYRAFEFVLQFAEVKGRSAQPPQLIAQSLR